MVIQAEATTPSAILDRASLLLDAFDGPGRLTLAQIVRRTGLPRSSAHRMLDRLVQLRWLRREGRDYELGIRLMELGSLAVHQDRLHRAAMPFLHELHRVTGFVVHLAVLDGPDVVYLDKVGGELSAVVPTRVGGRRPAACTAVGKAILAYSDERRIADALAGQVGARTRYSITTKAQLDTELDKVRAHGIAVEREESLPGFGCIAAPIGDLGEAAVAAVSVCGPLDRMLFDHRLSAPVRTTALNIWRHVDDGRVRVHPTLQQHPRPLGVGPAARPYAEQRGPRTA
ncbi:IclR family transcriptional regulator [Nocardia salmonicida]|uniref:IclR family transcriptional regulator n=1 Tax=Nocardia salmonicida TaxID=53431 RepID=A0ABZ1N3T3_9NOCA|nr:IclR family transcriptional regulator [Nocardia salmonicida]